MKALDGMGAHGRLAFASGAAFLLAAFLSDLIVHQTNGLTAIWPCNAFTLALLLVKGREAADRRAVVAGAFAGSLLSTVLRDQPALLCILFPIANTLESLVAAVIVRRMGAIEGPFDRMRDVLVLIGASLIAPLAPALIGSGAIAAAYGGSLAEGWLNWYGAAALGIVIVTPGVVVVMRLGLAQLQAARRHKGEASLILAIVAFVAVLVFYIAPRYLRDAPLLFLILPSVTLATVRLRQLGAVGSIVIVTLIGAQATVAGQGPIAQVGLTPAYEMLFLQGFLATAFLTALPVAAALAERDQRASETRLLAEQFRAVVENVDKVIFRVDRTGCWTYLNPAWAITTGFSVEASLGKHWTERIEGGGTRELADWIEPVLSGEIDRTRRLIRFVTAANDVRWMEISVQSFRNGFSGAKEATGTLRDVDDRKRLDANVLLAKRLAEERAHEAALLAATDELTGIANRRAFGQHLERKLEQPAGETERITLAIFDVDHFKLVNDRHGHAVGDRVLQRVVARSLGVIRSGDLLGRLGGEEFGIVMTGCSFEDARAAAERLRSAIAAPVRTDEEEELPGVTISVGIAAARARQSASDLLMEADRALYRAKEAGRNRVMTAF